MMSTTSAVPMPRRPLLRTLGLAFGLAVVIGETVGVGIMRTSGPIAGRLGEPWLVYLVWLGVGVYVLMISSILAELATAMPTAGGPYIYVRRAFGNYLGFVCGWSDYAIYVLAAGYLAIAASEFLTQIWPGLRGSQALIATSLIVLFAAFNSFGVHASSGAQQLLSLLKVTLLAALVIAALAYAGPSASYSAPAVAGGAGFVAIVVSMQTVLEVYGGFNSPCYFAEETTNSDRTIPRALMLGVLLVVGIYLAVNAALVHILSTAELAGSQLAAGNAIDPNSCVSARALIRHLRAVGLRCRRASQRIVARALTGRKSRSGYDARVRNARSSERQSAMNDTAKLPNLDERSNLPSDGAGRTLDPDDWAGTRLAGGLNANLGGRDYVPIDVERQIVEWARRIFDPPRVRAVCS